MTDRCLRQHLRWFVETSWRRTCIPVAGRYAQRSRHQTKEFSGKRETRHRVCSFRARRVACWPVLLRGEGGYEPRPHGDSRRSAVWCGAFRSFLTCQAPSESRRDCFGVAHLRAADSLPTIVPRVRASVGNISTLRRLPGGLQHRPTQTPAALGALEANAQRGGVPDLSAGRLGAFAYFGDPDVRLMGADAVVPQTRARTLRWRHAGRAAFGPSLPRVPTAGPRRGGNSASGSASRRQAAGAGAGTRLPGLGSESRSVTLPRRAHAILAHSETA